MADYTVVPVEKTSILRFVTIRGVNSLTANQASTQFLEYDTSAAVANRQGNAPQLFYNILVGIRENDSLDAAAQAAAMTAAVADYKQTNRYIANENDLEILADAKRIALGTFLRQERHSLQKDADADKMADFLITPLSATQYESLKLQVWDNFLLQVLEQKNTGLCDHFAAVLRALHFEKLQDMAEWHDLTNAIAVLPAAIFPLKTPDVVVARSDEKMRTPEITTAQKVAEIQNELQLLSVVKKEIALWESNTNEMQVLENEKQATVLLENKQVKKEEVVLEKPAEAIEIPIQKINPIALTTRISDVKAVGESTEKLLEMLRLPPSPRTELVRNRIAQREEELTAMLFEKMPMHKEVVVYAGAVWQHMGGVSSPTPTTPPVAQSSMSCFARPLGVADFMRVEQEACRYVPGEISHAENVMRGEEKSRTTRNLFRSENTYSYSKETEKEEERDTQTTDRFETEKETSRLVNEQIAASADINVMGTYGLTTINANAGASYDRAQEDSNRDMVRSSKETVEHVRQRMTERIKEERITKILKEYEETNVHSFTGDNANNTVGIYRWLDKLYLATMKNYGKRLTFEFNIPEPAAFHLWAMTDVDNVANAMVLTEPIKPALTSFDDITEANYKNWAGRYGAVVDSPPAENLNIRESYSNKDGGVGQNGLYSYNSLKVPKGYKISTTGTQVRLMTDARKADQGGYRHNFEMFLGEGNPINGTGHGNAVCYLEDKGRNINIDMWEYSESSELEAEKSIPLSLCIRILINGVDYEYPKFILNLTVVFQRSERLLNTWKQKTFTAIMSAYENKLAEYRNALDEAKAIARNEQRSATNPLMNEQIIRSELKKMCMYSFVKDAFFVDDPNNPWDVPMVGNLGFWNTWRYSDGFPEYNLSCDAKDKFRRERMAFLEQAFDWDLLVAEFLPYYYAKQPSWKKMYQLTDSDPTFLNFLQSGLAKVRVPVKVGKEAAALRFWQTQAQEIQQGNEPYLTADPYVQALLADIKRPAAEITIPGYDVRNLNSWIVRIPTTLTMLEEVSNGIVQSGIPCACGDLVNAGISMPCIETGAKH